MDGAEGKTKPGEHVDASTVTAKNLPPVDRFADLAYAREAVAIRRALVEKRPTPPCPTSQ